jgi:hypothetical protein
MRTNPLHTRLDGVVERYIKTAEEHLRMVVASNQRDWDANFAPFLLSHRASTHDTADLATAILVFGKESDYPAISSSRQRQRRDDQKSITLKFYWTIYTKSITLAANICNWSLTR